MSDSESDIELQLSAHALAALQEFKSEEQKREEEFQRLLNKADEDFERKKKEEGMRLFKEDWQLSQFWYDEATADLFSDALLEGADENTVIAIVSAPSVYAAILRKSDSEVPTKHIYLFEYDKRFALLAGEDHFYYYDFAHPLDIDEKLLGKVDRLLIDPPFLNEHCQTNFSITAKALLAPTSGEKTSKGVEKHRIITSTGERMREIVAKIYPGTKMTTFYPGHANGLSNEFRCYSNFEWSKWTFSSEP